MSAPLPVALDQPVTRAPGTSARERWRRWQWPLAVGAAVVAAALAGLVLLRPTSTGYLDPGNAAPDGTRALVRVLRDHGVDVRVRTRFDQVAADLSSGAGSTVVVARTDLLLGARTQDLRRAVLEARADLVLVGAGPALLADLDLPVVVASTATTPAVRDPQCADLVAGRAGPAVAGGVTYRPARGSRQLVTSCYPGDGGATYVALSSPGGGRTTLLGSGSALTNERLADAGDAALAIGTLATGQRVLWWTPNPADTAVTRSPTLRELVPRWVPWALAQLSVAFVVAAAWRGRRLGRLVHEPLPVVVRSVETTLGRARLYRKARARGRAAQVLRVAALRRIAKRCNLAVNAAPPAVAALAAARAGRPLPQVTELLVGPEPADDAALLALARSLDALETEVRRP